ncbi:hypothetical protein [Amycolatopsis nigrescens]|uniref:hypothetical protein n=1 Tax=Amycolatopsis nigrescens TaxID=381445 RepID=UPI000367DD25|nr:hypothetical protein [Amycolatopsis nigrescens]
MRTDTRLIRYPAERALEDAAFDQDTVPTRIFTVLLPLWRVEVRSTVTEGEPYQLIDRYLERGIAEAGLQTTAELAAFFAIEEKLVDRALRSLAAIGHLAESGGRFTLTTLGAASVRDQVRYVVTAGDRRRLYFDAFGSRPLTRPYYHSRTVTLLPEDRLAAALDSPGGSKFLRLLSPYPFRREALTELAGNPERDHFNLPTRMDGPESVAEDRVYLPLYLVRAVQDGKRVRHLAYTQAGVEPDLDVTALCEQSPDVLGLLETEDRIARTEIDWMKDWLSERDLTTAKPTLDEHGAWRVTLPGSAFTKDGPLPLRKLGSFVVRGKNFFHVWCTDERVRRQSLLLRVDAYLGARERTPADVHERIARISRQLELGAMNTATLYDLAMKAGMSALAAQLTQLDR